MRKICVVATNRSDYGRLKPIMDELKKREDVELQVVVGSFRYFDSLWSYLKYANPRSMAQSFPWYLRARISMLLFGMKAAFSREQLSRAIMRDGFTIDARIPMLLEGGDLPTMAYTDGFGLLELPRILEKLKPDIVVINGDRYEIFSVAIACAFMNIHLAHIEGGDVSGTIDNSIRHAITKLAHIHFPPTTQSAKRLLHMGEHPDTVFTYGSPIIDSLVSIDLSLDNTFYDRHPSDVGHIDLTKAYILVAHHPVTTEYADNYRQTKELLAALDEVGMPQFFIAPNIDAGSDGISVAMKEYCSSASAKRSVFHKHVALDEYIKLLGNAAVAVGNSSSLLREAAYLGTPAVLVGTRQLHRERGSNVLEVAAKRELVVAAIQKQLSHGRFEKDVRFGDGTAAVRIAKTLAEIDLGKIDVQKYFYEQSV